MAKFPEKQDETTALAREIASGLSNAIFSGAPATPAQIQAALTQFTTLAATADTKRAEAEIATENKMGALAALAALMRRVLDWAVKIPGITEAQLKLIGWGFAAPPTKTTAPARANNFRLHDLMGRVADFDWDKPSYKDGGKPTNYNIVFRAQGSQGVWDVHEVIAGASVTHTEERAWATGSWEVGVQAQNGAGVGPVSNTIVLNIV